MRDRFCAFKSVTARHPLRPHLSSLLLLVPLLLPLPLQVQAPPQAPLLLQPWLVNCLLLRPWHPLLCNLLNREDHTRGMKGPRDGLWRAWRGKCLGTKHAQSPCSPGVCYHLPWTASAWEGHDALERHLVSTSYSSFYDCNSNSDSALFGPSVAPDLDGAWILGGFCVFAMTVCASLVVLSEPITFNFQMLISHTIIVISLSYTHICVQHLKDYKFGLKKFCTGLRPQ